MRTFRESKAMAKALRAGIDARHGIELTHSDPGSRGPPVRLRQLAGRGDDVPQVAEVPWGFRILYQSDPFGNRLEFCEPLDADQRAAMPRWA